MSKRKIAVIVFDDGFKSHLRLASILRLKNIRAVFAITTGWVGRFNHLSWDDIGEIAEAGHEICSHGHTHRNLAELEEAEVSYELTTSKILLRDAVGKDIDCFIYPYGLYNIKSLRHVAKHYSYARSINTFRNVMHHPFTEIVSPYTFGGIEVFSIESINKLKMNFTKKSSIIIAKIFKGSSVIFFAHDCSIKTIDILIKTLSTLGYSFATLREVYRYYFVR